MLGWWKFENYRTVYTLKSPFPLVYQHFLRSNLHHLRQDSWLDWNEIFNSSWLICNDILLVEVLSSTCEGQAKTPLWIWTAMTSYSRLRDRVMYVIPCSRLCRFRRTRGWFQDKIDCMYTSNCTVLLQWSKESILIRGGIPLRNLDRCTVLYVHVGICDKGNWYRTSNCDTYIRAI